MKYDRSVVSYSGLLISYLGLNGALNLGIKLSVSVFGFRYPLALTVCHMAWSAVFLLPVMLSSRYRDKHLETIRKQWAGIIGIGLLMAASIALNNSSLLDMTLSLNQIIR